MLIYIVIPCYNEEAVLPSTLEKMSALRRSLKEQTGADASLLLVDDGSRDSTWSIISKAGTADSNIKGLRLSHNRGHQNALWAGLEAAVGKCDAAVTIDADLQDDEQAIIAMTKQVIDGKDIVYGVRKSRASDTWFKRTTAQMFYKFMRSMDSEIVYNHADFRMMSARAIEALVAYPERNLFLRGLVRQLGFNEGYVYYDRRERQAGESKYPLRKMLSFSIDGITSFSVAPLRLITFIGILMTLVSVIMIIYTIVRYVCDETIRGWSSILVSLWLIGGIITTGIGITGTYVGKIYTEVKRRPRYFISDKVNM